MIIVISPAKSLDYDTPAKTSKYSEPEFLSDSRKLMKQLRDFDPEQLSDLMNISAKLGQLNFERNLSWKTPFKPDNAKQALFAFQGDVYQGLRADEYSTADINFAQKHLRILSGLYGILKPLDLMQPYRLEMGTKLVNAHGKNLYEFWGGKLTKAINADLDSQPANSRVLVNLASNEYFSSLQPGDINADIVTPVFKDYSSGKYRVLSFFAKKARGEMVSYIVRNRLKSPAQIKDFDVDGYRYSEDESSPDKPVFLRRQK